LEEAVDLCLRFTSAVVTADMWDMERLTSCVSCASERIERLRRINVTGRAQPRIACAVCAGA